MAAQAEGADVGEVALAASLDDRHDMIGIPQGLAGACAEAPMLQE
jgi:hypothetical protein